MKLNDLNQILANQNFPITWPGHWINNAWNSGPKTKQTKVSCNPNCNKPLIEVYAERVIVNEAVDAAEKSLGTLAHLPTKDKIEIIKNFRHILGDYKTVAINCLRLEAGKPAWEAESDVNSALQYLDWVAGSWPEIRENLLAPVRNGNLEKEFRLIPIGITGAYLPFSTAFNSFAIYFTAAVLTGCPLVMVSSTHASLSALLCAMLFQETDLLPKGAINIIFNDFSSFKQVISDKRVNALLYNGSPEHCDTIKREMGIKMSRQMVLQCGGKNAVIIDESADLDQATEIVKYSCFKSAGQLCTSASRVFVHSSQMERFREKLLEMVNTRLTIGPTDRLNEKAKDEPFMGPLYSQKAVDKFLRFQTMAHREARETIRWGKILETENKGFFVTPGVHYLKEFDPGSSYQSNILFCPDLALYEFNDLKEMARQINSSDTTFVVSFVGKKESFEVDKDKFLCPNLLFNAPTTVAEAVFPLTGKLQNSLHRFHGPAIMLYLSYPQIIREK